MVTWQAVDRPVESGPARIVRWLAPLAVGLVGFELGRQLLQPGLGFWDTAELQTIGPVLGTGHPTGFPAYVILGWLASAVLSPLGEPAFRMNLLSAICVGVAAGLTTVVVRRLTVSTAVAIAAGLGFAATPIVWRIGTSADVHALHLVVAVLLVLLLVGWAQARDAGSRRADRWLLGVAAVYGVSLANHQLTLLLIPAIGLYVLAVEPGILRRPRFVAACAGLAAGVAGLLYLQLPLRAGPFRAPLVYGQPETLDGFLYVVLAEQFRGSFRNPLADLPAKLVGVADVAFTELGLLAVILPFAFVVTVARQPRYAVLSGVAVLITVVFAISYRNADIARYYLVPVFFAWTWLAILAAAFIDSVLPDAAIDGDPAPAGRSVRSVALVLAAAVLLLPTASAFEARVAAIDQRGDTAAREWVDAALAGLERDAVVVSWWSYSTPLWYAQIVEGQRPDIEIIDDRTRLDRSLGELTDVIDANLGRRPVYVIRTLPVELLALEAAYILQPLPAPAGNVLRVVAPREARS